MAGEGASADIDRTDERRRAAWMATAQAGDRGAYDALLRDCVPLIQAAARRRGVAPDLVDDVVQDVLLAIHRVRHTFDPGRSFDAWLHGIVRHRVVDALRRHGRRRARELHVPEAYEAYPDQGETAPGVMERTDRAKRLRKAVAGLPAGQREAVEHLLREATPAETAAATGRTRGALKVSLHRALKALRTSLVGED